MVQSCSECFTYMRNSERESTIGDFFYLKVSPKIVKRFKKQGKLNPFFIVPYEIVGHFCKVSYELDLSVDLEVVHPIFYVFVLKKCIGMLTLVMTLESMGINDSLSYKKVHIKILNHQVCSFSNKEA